MDVKASFVITSEAVTGTRITELMNLTPHTLSDIGHPFGRHGEHRRKHTAWTITGSGLDTFGDDLQEEFEKIITLLTPRRKALQELRDQGCRFQWWALGFHSGAAWGIPLEPDLLKELASFDAVLWLDIHTTDENNDKDPF